MRGVKNMNVPRKGEYGLAKRVICWMMTNTGHSKDYSRMQVQRAFVAICRAILHKLEDTPYMLIVIESDDTNASKIIYLLKAYNAFLKDYPMLLPWSILDEIAYDEIVLPFPEKMNMKKNRELEIQVNCS
jgi:hypothetical protein